MSYRRCACQHCGHHWGALTLRCAALGGVCQDLLLQLRSVRVFVICALRRWASVTRAWICVVAAPGIVVVAASSPGAEPEVVLLMSATDPPTTAPPATTAVIQIDGALIGSPIPLSPTPGRQRACSVVGMVGIDRETDATDLGS